MTTGSTSNTATRIETPNWVEATLRDVCEHLAPIDTTPCSPGERKAASWIAERLSAAGVDEVVLDEEARWGFGMPRTSLKACAPSRQCDGRRRLCPPRTRTSNLIAVGRLLLEPDDPEVCGPPRSSALIASLRQLDPPGVSEGDRNAQPDRVRPGAEADRRSARAGSGRSRDDRPPTRTRTARPAPNLSTRRARPPRAPSSNERPRCLTVASA